VSPDATFWSGRSVLITGHTGFKGGWLAIWLRGLGAHVHGFALEPPTIPNLFEAARVGSILDSDTRADLADVSCLISVIERTEPDVIFHLAAQSIVLEGYREPLRTLASNVIGTAHVLEAARRTDSARALVLVTTDKVYETAESLRPFRESDPLGGRDPYSASKAAAEIVAASYRSSFFSAGRHPARVATARAGNVIGGADWASDRLVPDCLRAFESGIPVRLRHPNAVRPWQHVLEPLSGYVVLAERLVGVDGEQFASAWNFGPDVDSVATVGEVAELTARAWGGDARIELAPDDANPPEAEHLTLDATRARVDLQWRPRWSLVEAVEQTVSWHRAWRGGGDMLLASRSQIEQYEAAEAS